MSIPATAQRCQRTMRVFLAMVIIICTLAFTCGYLAVKLYQSERITVYQAGLLRVSDARIDNLVERVKELEKQTEAAQLEKAITRGTKRTMIMTVTGYCPCEICCGKTDGITASGTKAKEGRTIAASPDIPFGTNVFIPGIGWRVVEDRGSAITDGHIDVYMDTHESALAFGRKTAEVIIQ